MKLLLLKILLQRRSRDEGFTLPMVIALGLVMLLLGAVSITTANEENITAISQNSRSDALAIAEVGVARYRELLDRNRTLAVNDSSQWTTETQVCNNNINEAGNNLDDNVPSLTPGTSNPIALNEDGQELNNDGDDTDSFAIGTYSLVSYKYINDDNEDGNSLTPGIANGWLDLTSDAANRNARGRLTVKGTAPGDSSEAQIQVEIPVRINPNDMTNLTPALWIGNTSITAANLGSLTIRNGNVVISDPAVVTGTTRDGCRDFSSLASTTPRRPVISDNRNLPSIQRVTDNINEAAGATMGDRTNNNIPAAVAGAVTFGSTADKAYKLKADDPARSAPGSTVAFKASDCISIKSCRYYYDPTGTGGLIYSGLDIVTDGVAKTTLLLQQDLTINATDTTDLTYPTGRDIKVGSSSSFGSSDGFEIYVTGSGNDITINADNGRTIDIRAFIHAPQGKLTITGNGIVNIFGSVWVNDFENTSATVNISPDNIKTSSAATTGDRAYLFYATTPGRTPKPLTGSPTNWKTEEVN